MREGVLYAVCCLTLFCKCSVAISYYCKVPFVKNIFFQINTSHSLGQEVKCFLITMRRMNPLFSWLILLVLSVPCIRETKTDLDRFFKIILFNCYIIRNLYHDNYFLWWNNNSEIAAHSLPTDINIAEISTCIYLAQYIFKGPNQPGTNVCFT